MSTCINCLYFTIVLLQSSFVGAIAVGDLVKSTLGPKGMVSVILSVRTLGVIVTGGETPLDSSFRTRSC